MGGSVIYQSSASRYFIQIYWESKKYRIWRHPISGDPFFSKRSAEKQLHRIQTEIDDGDFQPKYWMPDSPMLIKEYARQWLEIKDVSHKTLTGYRTATEKYIVPFMGKKDIRRIRANDITLFKIWLSKRLKPKGIYNTVSILRTLFRDAYKNEDITRVPPFPRLSIPKPKIKYISLAQQRTLLAAIPFYQRPIFDFAMEYGLRIGEVRALQKDCIKSDVVIIKRAFSDNRLKETKTGQWREYDLTKHAQRILDDIEPHLSPFIFVREDGLPYTNKNLNKIWHDAEEKAGIKMKLYNACRHSLGCQLLDQGEDMDLVRHALGHTKAEMTRRYAKRSNPVLRRALEDRRSKVIDIKGIVTKQSLTGDK